MRRQLSEWLPNNLWMIGILLAGGLAYSNSFSGVFLFDDVDCIVDNANIRSLEATWNATGDDVVGGLRRRPVVRWSLALNYAVGKQNPSVYHWWNLAVHLVAAVFLFGIVRRTLLLPRIPRQLQAASRGLAFAIALLWVAHPLQTESVTYVIQRLESMMGMFYFACLYCVLRGSQSERPRAWYLLAVACCSLGMGSKEVMITAPIVVLLFDRVFLSRTWGEVWLQRKWMYVGFLPATCWLVWISYFAVTSSDALNRVPTPFVPDRWTYLCTQPAVILHYLRLCVWPHEQCLDYGWKASAGSATTLISSLVVLGVLAASVSSLFRRPSLGFLAVSFFLVLTPTSSIIPLHLAFEHRMYVPLALVISLVVVGTYWGISNLQRLRNVRSSTIRSLSIATLCIVALTLATLTYLRNQTYHSELGMWQDVTRKAPGNPRGHSNLGMAFAKFQRNEAAEECFRTALRIEPNFTDALENLGAVLVNLDRHDEAERTLRHALKLGANGSSLLANLGRSIAHQGRYEEAIEHYQDALKRSPQATGIQLAMGYAWVGCKNRPKAMLCFRRELEENPNSAEAHNNLGVLLKNDRPDIAVQHYRAAISLKGDYAEAHNNLANVLFRQGRVRLAISHYRQSIAIDPKFLLARQNLRRVLSTLQKNSQDSRS